MSWTVVYHFAKHEWRALLRRNFAGLVAGLIPIAASPIVGLISASMAQTLDELKAYGMDSSESHIILGGLAGLAFFPILYAVFLTSDSIVLESELGTIELIFWSPVSELDVLVGKALMPFLLNLGVGAINFAVFSASYEVGASLYRRVLANPWPLTGLTLLLLAAILLLTVEIGILVSAFSSGTKAAATISLAVGGLLAIMETAAGLLLIMMGTSSVTSILVLFGLTRLLTVGAGIAVVLRFGNRELYFLRKQGGELP